MISAFLCALLVTGQAAATTPPSAFAPTNPVPLTDEQLVRLRELVRATQTTAERLRQDLGERERQLADKYARFDLDDAGAEKLQGEIVGLQKELLANYHRLQVELRKIVGPERFAQLKLRLDNALRPKGKGEEPSKSTRGRPETNAKS